jgi:hypothetical protein
MLLLTPSCTTSMFKFLLADALHLSKEAAWACKEEHKAIVAIRRILRVCV